MSNERRKGKKFRPIKEKRLSLGPQFIVQNYKIELFLLKERRASTHWSREEKHAIVAAIKDTYCGFQLRPAKYVKYKFFSFLSRQTRE